MTRIEAALDALEDLGRSFEQLDARLRPVQADLGAAIAAAWASSGAFLGPLDTTDDELATARWRAGEIADGLAHSRRRLEQAGSGGVLLWEASPGTAGTAATRLTAALATAAGEQLAGRLWQRLARTLGGSTGTDPVPYVVSTRTETLSAAFAGEVSVTVEREEFSDGQVRITAIDDVALDTGAGLGARCTLTASGRTVFEGGSALSATLTLHGRSGRTWVFDDAAAADRWWRVHGTAVRLGSALGGLSLGRHLPEGIGRLGAWFGAVAGHPATTDPDETFEQVAVDGTAEAETRSLLGRAAAVVTSGGSVRHGSDGTVTLAWELDATAQGSVGLWDGDGAAPGPHGTLHAGASVVFELTVDDGSLTGLTLRSVTLDEAGLRPDLGAVLDGGSVAAVAARDLHAYETTVMLDLTDPAVRRAVEQRIGLDPVEPAAQLRTALQTMTLDAELLRLATVTVLERTAPVDRTTGIDCSVDTPALSASVALSSGVTTERTVGAWTKPSGAVRLVALP